MAVNRGNNSDVGSGVGISKDDQDATLFIDVDEATGDMVFEDEQTGPHTLTSLFTSAAGALAPFLFLTSGNSANKWLGAHTPSQISLTKPSIVMQASDLKGWTYMNDIDDTDLDIEIYKNGILGTTFSVRNKRWEYDVGISSISFAQGDRMSVFIKKYTGGTGNSNPNDVRVIVMLKVASEFAGSGGAQNGL